MFIRKKETPNELFSSRASSLCSQWETQLDTPYNVLTCTCFAKNRSSYYDRSLETADAVAEWIEPHLASAVVCEHTNTLIDGCEGNGRSECTGGNRETSFLSNTILRKCLSVWVLFHYLRSRSVPFVNYYWMICCLFTNRSYNIYNCVGTILLKILEELCEGTESNTWNDNNPIKMNVEDT